MSTRQNMLYDNFEKDYKKKCLDKNFDKYYWIFSSLAIVLMILLSKEHEFTFDVSVIASIITLITTLITYYFTDVNKVLRKIDINNNIRFYLYSYINYKERIRLDNLLAILRKYNINTKNNLKLVVAYYNSKKPIKLESDFLGWIVTSVVTLASFVEIAYDKEKAIIDYQKLSVVLGSTFGIVSVFFIVMLIGKFVIEHLKLAKTDFYSNIESDLTYIYLNFDKYRNQLCKKNKNT